MRLYAVWCSLLRSKIFVPQAGLDFGPAYPLSTHYLPYSTLYIVARRTLGIVLLLP